MVDFIKRNKIFCTCMSFLMIVMITLGAGIFIKRNSGEELPILFDPSDKKEPVISLFTGNFYDESNTLTLAWDYETYRHKFNKVELYFQDELIQKFNQTDKSFEVKINEYGITTGDNLFTLKLYYDQGEIAEKTANVFVDYIFDISMNHQPVDNDLGKGYLLTIKYSYNSVTPVGIPTLTVDTPLWYKWHYIDKKTVDLGNGYLETEARYMLNFKEFPDEDIYINLSYNFESVGVRESYSIQENLSTLTYDTTKFHLK